MGWRGKGDREVSGGDGGGGGGGDRRKDKAQDRGKTEETERDIRMRAEERERVGRSDAETGGEALES